MRMRARTPTQFVAWVFLIPFSLMSFACTMPGKSFTGPLPRATSAQLSLAEELKQTVTHLAVTLGQRDTDHPEILAKSADYIEQQLRGAGLKVTRQTYEAANQTCANLIAQIKAKTA